MDYTALLLESQPDDIDVPVLIDADQTDRFLSRRQYASTVKRTSVGLQALGVANQDGVGLLSLNDIYYHALGDGAIAAGAAFAPIPTFVKQRELETALSAALIKWLFVEPEFLELSLSATKAAGIPVANVIVFDPPGRTPYSGPHQSFSKLLATADEELFQNVNTGKDLTVQITHRMFTSGTTGSVKAGQLSHKVQVARINYQGQCVTNTRERSLYMIGVYHGTAQLIIAGAFATDGSVLYLSRALGPHEAPAIIDSIQSLGITSVLLTPPMVKSVTAAIVTGVRPQEALQPLRTVMLAGTPCPTDVAQGLRVLLPDHARLMVFYGSTEAASVAAIEVTPNWVTGQVGPVAAEVEAKIISADTLEELEEGEEGELCVRSPILFSSYCNNPAASEAAYLPGGHGWFRTGDRAKLNGSTRDLVLSGRIQENFKANGQQVAPEEVEGELKQHPEIEDAYVTSTPARDEEKSFEAMAYIVRPKDSQITAQEVVDFVGSVLCADKAPTGAVIFCDEIPRGAMGKPVKTLLADILPLPGSGRFLARPK